MAQVFTQPLARPAGGQTEEVLIAAATQAGVSWMQGIMKDIRAKRVYEPANARDGFRVLVDRVWPRGVTKEKLKADLWLKDVAPSTALRKWFSHDQSKWDAFKSRYFLELDAKPKAVAGLLDEAAKGRVTLLFSSRDVECNQAVALKEYLLSQQEKR